MIICAQCGRENEDRYKFCLGCGSQLPRQAPAAPAPVVQMIDCPHCTTPVPSNFKFCGACGGPIAAALAAPQHETIKPAPIAQAQPVTTPAPRVEPTVEVGLGSFASPPASRGLDSMSSPSVGNAVAKLVVIRPDGSEGATIPLHEGELVIGRASDYQALSGDPFLSPSHAALSIRDGQFTIRDVDSLNGIFFRIRTEQPLQSGDSIRIGQELLVFESLDKVDPLPVKHSDTSDTQRGGSPDVGYWGRLSLIGGPNVVTRAFVLKEDEITLGREIGDIVFRDDGFVSGRHARLSKVDGRVVLKDLGSSNGTYVRIRGEKQLQDGDLILMGQQLFRLVA